jgi:hypothetical protein
MLEELKLSPMMKLCNRVQAPFAGRVDAVMIEGVGTIVQKGQTLFKVTPDERAVDVDHAAVARDRKATLTSYLAAL